MTKNYQAILAVMLILFVAASSVFSGLVYAQQNGSPQEDEEDDGVPIVSDILDIAQGLLSVPALAAAGLAISAAQTVGDVVGIIGNIAETIYNLFESDPEEACEGAAELYSSLYDRALELADERERQFRALDPLLGFETSFEEERAELIEQINKLNEQINQLNAVIDSIMAELAELEQFLRLRCPEKWREVEDNIRELDEERERGRTKLKWGERPPPAMPANWPENFDDLKSQIKNHLIEKAMWLSGKILPADYGRNNIHRPRDWPMRILDLKDAVDDSTDIEGIHDALQEAKQAILDALGVEETSCGGLDFQAGSSPYNPNPYEEDDLPTTPAFVKIQIEALKEAARRLLGWDIGEGLTRKQIEQIARRLTKLYLEIAEEIRRELNVLINLTAERSGIREETGMPEQAQCDQTLATRDMIIPFRNTRGLLKSLQNVVIYPSKTGKETITVKVSTRDVKLEGQTITQVRKNRPYILKLKFPSGLSESDGVATVTLENAVFVPVKQVENYKKLLGQRSFIAKIKQYFGGKAPAPTPELMLFKHGYLTR